MVTVTGWGVDLTGTSQIWPFQTSSSTRLVFPHVSRESRKTIPQTKKSKPVQSLGCKTNRKTYEQKLPPRSLT